jgi:hypothetical protein
MDRVILSLAKGALAAIAIVVVAAMPAVARELAVARGPIAIHDAASGQRSPACAELVVEARDALDNHLIGRTQPQTDTDGTCRYALSVPAQTAVWLRLRPALVASERVDMTSAGSTYVPAPPAGRLASSRSVQIRFTVISPNTYFFAPNEQKTVPLSY